MKSENQDKLLGRALALAYVAVVIATIAFLAGSAHQRTADRTRKLDRRLWELEAKVDRMKAPEGVGT